MFKILNGRDSFFQWDLNQKLIVEDETIKQVHFSNLNSTSALVCEVVTQADGVNVVDVPNILLQDNSDLKVYAFNGNYTKFEARFEVVKKPRPEDYVYTETQILTWNEVLKKVDEALDSLNGITPGEPQSGSGTINFLTIDESNRTSTVIKNTDSGKPYDFKEISVSVYLPRNSKEVGVCNFTVNGSYSDSITLEAGERCYAVKFKASNGSFVSLSTTAADFSEDTVTEYAMSNSANSSVAINELSFNADVLPVGTAIEIEIE